MRLPRSSKIRPVRSEPSLTRPWPRAWAREASRRWTASNNRLVVAGIEPAFVDDFADIDPVLEQIGQRSLGERNAAPRCAVASARHLGMDALLAQVAGQPGQAAELEI